MRKLFNWCKRNSLGIAALILLAFIPLYPKLPLVDIKNTWVYIRAEDFLVLFTLFWWSVQLIRRKVTLATPLTAPVLMFWIAGALATLHGMVLIFPTIGSIFANVSFLSYLRRIEYMSVFFIAYAAVRDRKMVPAVITTLVGTVFAVGLYGLGQKYMGLPAYLTMNEEFAKGIPLQLSQLSRLSSTFGGHYDLAAYLVFCIPMVAALFFSYRNIAVRALLAAVAALSMAVLFMTVSRISLFAVLAALGIVAFVKSRKLVLFLIPAVAVAGLVFVSLSPRILDRFSSTLKTVNLIVDADTGYPVGNVKEVGRSYFADKKVWQRFDHTLDDVTAKASPSATLPVFPENITEPAVLLTEPTAPTGEDLPSGTGYVNLELSPVVRQLGQFFYEPGNQSATMSAQVYVISGRFLIKKVYAYDLSFTTRFQGEWPNALAAFQRNIFLGSGYGSVSLAVDNSYLRMLAETGIFGLASFLAIFLCIGVYLAVNRKRISSPVVSDLMLGYAAGLVGLSINAVFIDVFEASKVAFVLWLVTGFVVGIVHLYTRSQGRIGSDVKKLLVSPLAVAVYLAVIVFVLYGRMTRNYFVGDDFTWFRWAADCVKDASGACLPAVERIARYFTRADGFFYRPGMKTYMLLMYQLVWLNQSVYHAVSLVLHYVTSVLVFFLAREVFGRKREAALAAFLFAILAGFSEIVFWVSATGHLFAAACMLASLLFYIRFRKNHSSAAYIGALAFFIIAPLFHEMGIVTPLLFVAYEYILAEQRMSLRSMSRRAAYWVLAAPVPVYLAARFMAGSHGLSGDYSYNFVKLPLNAVGNSIGYALSGVSGIYGMPVYEKLRAAMRAHIGWSAFAGVTLLTLAGIAVRKAFSSAGARDRSVVRFSAVFFIIALLPFLGLGNIAARYGYLASAGLVFILVFGLGKLHAVLRGSGQSIAQLATAVVVLVFVMLQVVGVEQLHRDWYEAGVRVQRFFVSMESNYQDYWTTEPMTFYFAEVPIRHRDAWVFPVGLSDAVWFILHNPKATVNIVPSRQDAVSAVLYGDRTQRAFVFEGEGQVTELEKPAPEEAL